jgi:hypothetical protein
MNKNVDVVVWLLVLLFLLALGWAIRLWNDSAPWPTAPWPAR